MAKKSPNQKLTEAMNDLTAHLKSMGESQQDMDSKILQAEQESGKQRRRLQQSNLNLQQVNSESTLQMARLARNMGRFHMMMAGAAQRNIDLTRALAQNAIMNNGASREFATAANTGRISLTQAIETFSQMTEMGMGGFSNATLRLGTDLKNLGVDMRSVLEGIRFQTQMMGFSEETSRMFMDTLVSTAAMQRTSINELIGTLNSFKDEFTKISVQFGPEMALFAQRAAQGLIGTQTELFEPTLRLITDLMVGTEGMIKAGRLAGQPFRPGMDETQFRSTLQSALAGLQRIDPGTVGGPRIEAITAGFGITQEQLMLSRRLDGSFTQLSKTMTEELSESVTARAATQAWQTQLLDAQQITNSMLEKIATSLKVIGPAVVGIALASSGKGILNFLNPMKGDSKFVQPAPGTFGPPKPPGGVLRGIGKVLGTGAMFLGGPIGIAAMVAGTFLVPKVLKAFQGGPGTAAGDQREEQIDLARENLNANKEIADSTKKIADRGRDQGPGATGNLSRLLTTLINNSERQAALLEDGNNQRDIFNDFMGSAPTATNGMVVKPSGG